MTTAKYVANFFIELANDDEYGDGMTNMRLNKLLYFAQGHYFARTGTPLFNDDFEAWEYGPVVSSIYQQFKNYGRKPIADIDADYSNETFNSDELEVLLDVAMKYGKYSTSELVNMTHRNDSPWAECSKSASQVITKKQIKDYFSNQSLPTFDDMLSALDIPLCEKRSTDGFILLPQNMS
ncbi:MAG: DUF4065 domain-containing protein [Oscillospiraceae bacterium]|nr:DUF4065 domain-containing protein [Oscillospiraceae bacterium]